MQEALIVCLDSQADFEYSVPEALKKFYNRLPASDDVLHLSQSAIVVDRLSSHDIYVAICAALNHKNLPYISLDLPSEFALVGKSEEEMKAILEKLVSVRDL